MSFNPRVLTERTLKGFVDRWVRAQRAKPCPTPDQWPPARTACQEDIAQLLGFANWHEAITAIRQLQSEPDTSTCVRTSARYQRPIDSTYDAATFLIWAYEQGIRSVDITAGQPLASEGQALTIAPLTPQQKSLFQEACLPPEGQRAIRYASLPENPSIQILFRPNQTSIQVQQTNVNKNTLRITLAQHQPVLPPGFEAMPQALLDLLANPPKQGLVLLAGLSELMPSMAIFMAERHIRTPHKVRMLNGLSDLDLEAVFGYQANIIDMQGDESVDQKIRRGYRYNPDAMLVEVPLTEDDISQVITASMTGHLVYTSSCSRHNRITEAVVDLVQQFPEDEHHARMVDILSCMRLIIGGYRGNGPDGNWQQLYEYLPMTDGLVDELIQSINTEQAKSNPPPLVDSLSTMLTRAIQKHGVLLPTQRQIALSAKAIEGDLFEESPHKLTWKPHNRTWSLR